MSGNSQVIYPPNTPMQEHNDIIFLCGHIMSTNDFKWCDQLLEFLKLKNVSATIYNPHPGLLDYNRQLRWEQGRLQVSNIVVVNVEKTDLPSDGIFGEILGLTQKASKVLVICGTEYSERRRCGHLYAGSKIEFVNDVAAATTAIVGSIK